MRGLELIVADAWFDLLARGLNRLQPQRLEAALSALPRITGPALLVGSAPSPTRPIGVGDDWFLISVNASQTVLETFGLREPDLTVLRNGLLDRNNLPNGEDLSRSVWDALSGRATRHLLASTVVAADRNIDRVFASKGFRADAYSEIDRHARAALVHEMSGVMLPAQGGPRSMSNGIFAAALALKLGASPVVMAGFSAKGGWSQLPGRQALRIHLEGDVRACRGFVRRGLPIASSEAAFSALTGIPLWTGA